MLTVIAAGASDATPAEPRPPAVSPTGITQLVSTVERAVSDAAEALLRAEQEREAARTALHTADADVDEARQVLQRLRRLHTSLTARDAPP